MCRTYTFDNRQTQLSCDIDNRGGHAHVSPPIAGTAIRRGEIIMATATVQATRARELHNEELTGEQVTLLRQRLLDERKTLVQRVHERLGLAAPLPTHH